MHIAKAPSGSFVTGLFWECIKLCLVNSLNQERSDWAFCVKQNSLFRLGPAKNPFQKEKVYFLRQKKEIGEILQKVHLIAALLSIKPLMM